MSVNRKTINFKFRFLDGNIKNFKKVRMRSNLKT